MDTPQAYNYPCGNITMHLTANSIYLLYCYQLTFSNSTQMYYYLHNKTSYYLFLYHTDSCIKQRAFKKN